MLAAAACLGLTGWALPAAFAARTAAVSVQPFFEYTVSFVGHGSYEVVESNEGGGKLTTKASFEWKTVYPTVLVPTTSSSPLGANEYPALGLGQEGSGQWTITNTGSEDESCSNSGTLGIPNVGGGGGGHIKVHRAPPGTGSGVLFNLVALGEYTTATGAGNGVLPCDPEDFWHDWVVSFTGVGFKHASPGLPDVSPLSATVKLTPSELKHGTVSKSVSISAAEKVPTDCGSGNGSTCTQSYTWSGNVRFTKHKFKTG